MRYTLLQTNHSSQLQSLLLALAIIGVFIIISSIIIFFTKSEIKDKVQEIKLLGADLRISIVSFFVFIGLILILPIIYTNYIAAITEVNTLKAANEEEKKRLQTERDELKKKIEDLQNGQIQNFTFLLDLDSLANIEKSRSNEYEVGYSIPDLNNGQLQYTDEPQVVPFQNRHLLAVTIKDQKPDTELNSLGVRDKRTNKHWIIESMKLNKPVVKLNLSKRLE